MGKCSEEVLNSIREELKSLGVTDTEVINKIVSTFESTVETDEKAEAVATLLNNSLFTKSDKNRLDVLINKSRRAKGDINKVTSEELSEFSYLWTKWQHSLDGGIFINEGLKTKDTSTLSGRLQKLKASLLAQGKTKEAKVVSGLISRIDRARTINLQAGMFLRNADFEGRLEKSRQLLSAIDSSYQFEAQNNPELIKLNEERFKLVGELQLEKDPEKKKKLQEKITENIAEVRKKTNDILLSKAFIKQKKADSAGQETLYDSIKELSTAIDSNASVYRLALNEALSRVDTLPQDKQLFELAKQSTQIVNTAKALMDAIRKESGGVVTVGDLRAVIGDLGVAVDAIILEVVKNERLSRASRKKLLDGSMELSDTQLRNVFNKLANIAIDQAFANGIALGYDYSPAEQRLADQLKENSNGMDVENEDQVNNDTVMPKVRTAAEAKAETLATREQKIKEFKENINFKQLYSLLKGALERIETLRRLPQFAQHVSRDMLIAALGPQLELLNPDIYFNTALAEVNTVGRATKPALSSNYISPALQQVFANLGVDPRAVEMMPEFRDPDNFARNWDRVISFDIEIKGDNVYMISVRSSVTEERLEPIIEQLSRSPAKGTTGSFEVYSIEDLTAFLQALERMQNGGWKVAGFNNVGFDLSHIANRIGTPEAKQQAARIALRSYDLYGWLQYQHNAVTNLNNVSVAILERGKKAGVTGKNVVDLLLEAKTEEEAARAIEYSQNDSDLVFEILENLRARPASNFNIAVNNVDVSSVNVSLNTPLQTWQLSIFHSANKNNFSSLFSSYGIEVQESVQGLIGESNGMTTNARILFEIEKVRDQLMLHMSLALRADPDTRVVGETLIKEAERLTKKEQDVLVQQVIMMQRHRKAGIEAKKKLFDDSETPKFILSVIDGEPRFIEATPAKSAESIYEESVIGGFIDFFTDMANENDASDKVIQKRNELIEKYGYRAKNNNETQEEYITNFIKEVILPSVKASSIADFGNGKTDYAPAWNVGYAIAQIVSGRRDGIMDSRFVEEQNFVTPLSTMNDLENNASRLAESIKIQQPHRRNVSMFAPISLKQYEEVYNDWALRKRISFILNGDRYKGLSEAELRQRLADLRGEAYLKKVNALAKSTTIIPDVAPTVNNRLLFNNLPSIDDTLDRTIETLLDLPAIGIAVVHDSMFIKTKAVVDSEGRGIKFTRLEASPGVWSARAIMNPQLMAQLAWYQTYGITEGALEASLSETAKGMAEGKLKLKEIDYFDFDFNGVHHMLMLMLAYNLQAPTKGARNLIETLNLQEWWNSVDSKKDDFYSQVADQVIKNIGEQYVQLNEKRTTSALNNKEQAQFERLERWHGVLSKLGNNGKGRAFFKKTVLPRLYSGGVPSISKAIEEQLQDPEFKDLIEGIQINNEDIMFLMKEANFTGSVGLISLIDTTLGIEAADRNKLKNDLFQWYNKLYFKNDKHQFHEAIKAISRSTAFGRGIIDQDILTDLINVRLEMAARMLVKPGDLAGGKTLEAVINEKKNRLAKLWESKINEGRAYVERSGGRLTTREQYIKLAEIMGRDPNAWKELPLLTAINTANRTPLRIREEAIREAEEVYGVNVEEYMGNTGDYLFFQSLNRDLAGGRMYTSPTSISYQGPSYSQVATLNPDDPGDVDASGMWEIDEYSFVKLAKENPEEARRYITQLVLQQYELRLATEYMSKDYNDKTEETPDKFLEDWSAVSRKERVSYAERRDLETLKKTKAESTIGSDTDRAAARNWIEAARKRGLLLEQGIRFLSSPSRSVNDTSRVFDEDNHKKGVFAFRPKASNIDISDLPIYALTQLAIENRIDKENEAWVRASKKQEAPKSVTDIIPEKAIGYTHSVTAKSLPFIPRQRMALSLLSNTTDSSTKLAIEQNRIQNRLYRFAKQNGLLPLAEQGKWAELHYIRLAHIRGGFGLLKKLNKVYNANETVLLSEYNTGVSKFLSSMFDIIEFQHNTQSQDVTQLDFNYFGGFNPNMLKSLDRGPTYYNLLRLLSDLSEQLSTLKYGLVVSSRSRVEGPPTQFENTTRTLPVTVQAMDAVNLVFILYNLTKVKDVATQLLKDKKIAEIQYDPSGKVIPETIPAHIAVDLLPKILESKEFKDADIRSAGLYILVDGENAEFVIDRPTTETMDISTPLGGMSQALTRDGATKYAFTPEMLNTLLQALRNSVVLNQAELAYATNKSIGQRKSNLERGNLQRTLEYYNGSRELVADEATIFSAMQPGVKTIQGGVYDARYNVTYSLLDSIKYLAKDNISLINPKLISDKVPAFQVKAYELALIMPLKRAIADAERIGVKSVLTEINSLLMTDEENIRQLLPVVSMYISNPDMTRNSIESLVAYTLRKKGVKQNTIENLTEIIIRIQRQVKQINDPLSNPYYTSVRGFLQRADIPTNELNVEAASVKFITSLEAAGTKLKAEDKKLIQLATKQTIDLMNAESGLELTFYNTDSTETATKFGNETVFLSKFNKAGETLNNQIKSLGLDSLTEQTYRAMVGYVLHKHPELEEHLTINIDRVENNKLAKIRKTNDVFEIVFAASPDKAKAIIAERSAEQAVETLAHELSHIALNYSKIRDRIGFEEAMESLQTESGQEAIERMVINAFSGNQSLTRADINKLIKFYQENVEEALVMWGSQMLITRAVGGKDGVELKAMEETNDITTKVNSWWKRTFSAIAYFANGAAIFLDEMMSKKKYRGVSEKVNRVFNAFFDATSDTRTAVQEVYKDALEDSFIIYDASINYNPGVTPEQKEAFDTEKQRNMSEYQQLKDELATLEPGSPRHTAVAARIESIKDRWVNNRDHLGISDEVYYTTLTELRNRSTGGTEFADPENDTENLVLVDHIIRKLSDFRGKRVDSRGTAAYLARQLMGLFSQGIAMENDGHKRNRMIQSMQNFSTSILGLTGAQTGLTYNSPFGIVVSLANLIDAEAQTTDAYFTGNEGLDGLKQNQYQVNLLVNQVSSVYNQVVAQFSSVVPKPGATNKASDIVLEAFSYLVNGTINPSFTTEEQNAIRRLGDVYRKSSEMLHNIIRDANLKDKNRKFHDSFLAFKLDIDQFRENKNPKNYKGRRRQFLSGLTSLVRAKQLKELVDSDKIHPVTFMLTSGMPLISTGSLSDVRNDKEFLSFIERNVSITPNNSFESIMFNAILSYAAREKEGSSSLGDKKDSIKRGAIAGNINAMVDLKRGYKALLRASTNRVNNLNSLLIANESGITPEQINIIRDAIKNTITNDEANPPGLSKKINAMRTERFPIKIKEERQILNPETNSIMELLAIDFINTIGTSAAVTYADDINLTVDDIFGDAYVDTLGLEELQSIRAGFSRDIRSIIKSIGSGLGQQAVSRSLIYKITNVQGYDILKLISILKDYVENGSKSLDEKQRGSGSSLTYGQFEMTPNGPRATGLTPEQVELLKSALTVLEHKYKFMWNMRSASRETEGSNVSATLLKYGTLAANILWSPNQIAAGILVDSVAGAFGSSIIGGPMGALNFYGKFIADSLRLSAGAFGDGWKQTQIRGDFADFAEILWDSNNNFASSWEQLYGEVDFTQKVNRGFNRFLSATQALNMATSLAARTALASVARTQLNRQLNTNNLQEIRRLLIDSSIEKKDYRSYVTLLKKLRNNGQRSLPSPESVLRMKAAGIFELGTIEALKYLRSSGKVSITTYMDKILELPDDFRVLVDGISLSKKELIKAVGSIEKFQELSVKQGLVSSSVMDAITDDTPLAKFMSLYRSYSILFAGQMMLRNSARMSTSKMAGLMLAYFVGDIMYQTFLAVASGFLSLDEIDRLLKGKPSEKLIQILARSVIRNPMLTLNGNFILDIIFYLANTVAGKRGTEPELQGLGLTAATRLLGNLAKNTNTFINAESDEERLKAAYNGGLGLIPIFSNGIVKAAVNQGLANEAQSKVKGPYDSGKRDSTGKKLNTAFSTAYGEYQNMNLSTPDSIFKQMMYSQFEAELSQKLKQYVDRLRERRLPSLGLTDEVAKPVEPVKPATPTKLVEPKIKEPSLEDQATTPIKAPDSLR
jgi:hypothetical protein